MTRYSCYVFVIPWFSTENPRVNQSLWPITKTQLTKESILDGQQCTWQALRAGNVHLRSLFVSGWEVARKFASSVEHCTHTSKSVRLLSGENGSKFLPTLKPSSGQFQSYHLEKVGQLSIFTWHHNGHFSACRKKKWRLCLDPKLFLEELTHCWRFLWFLLKWQRLIRSAKNHGYSCPIVLSSNLSAPSSYIFVCVNVKINDLRSLVAIL